MAGAIGFFMRFYVCQTTTRDKAKDSSFMAGSTYKIDIQRAMHSNKKSTPILDQGGHTLHLEYNPR